MLPVLNSHSPTTARLTSPALGDTKAATRQLKSATFLLKYACNLNCSFCLNDWRGKETPKDELTFLQQKEALRKLKDAGVTHVTFTGGEPALHPQLADLILYANSLGMRTLLQTNGTLLSDELLAKVKPVIAGIQISLHGLRKEQHELSRVDSFDKIVTSMKKVKQHGIMLFTNFVITTKNKHALKDYVKLLNELKVDVASFTRLYPAGQALPNWQDIVVSGDEYAEFLRELEQLQKTSSTKLYIAGPTDINFLFGENIKIQHATCGAGKDEIAINPNGDILPCPSWNEPVANITKSDVKTAWDKGFLAELGASHDGTQGCMLARRRGKTELERQL